MIKDSEKKILEKFEKIIPDMTDLEREKLLNFGERILHKESEQKKENADEKKGGIKIENAATNSKDLLLH